MRMAPLDIVSTLTARAIHARYFVFPDSLDPLPPVFQIGLVPVALFALTSVISVSVLLAFITYRLLSWRRLHREIFGYNQYVTLIFNLLLADLHQSISFSISFHWLHINKIIAPTAPCFIQAWFLHLGDVSSGFFVLAIAIHTWLGIVKGYKLPYFWFVVCIICIWMFALLLTLLGPAMYRDRFFARAGGWCWVSGEFQTERLLLHYLWIFIVEFGTMAIYGHIFLHLRGRIRNINVRDSRKFSHATKSMVVYPIVYIILTLPIAVGRMIAMTGVELPDTFFCVAGSLLTSCGWIDAMTYTLTRRVFVNGDLSTGQPGHSHTANRSANPPRPSNRNSNDDGLDLRSVSSKSPILSTTNRMTNVVSSEAIDQLSPIRTSPPRTPRSGHYGRNSITRFNFADTLTQQQQHEHTYSRKGSQAKVVSPIRRANSISVVTEIDLHIESSPSRSEEFDVIIPEKVRVDQDLGKRRMR